MSEKTFSLELHPVNGTFSKGARFQVPAVHFSRCNHLFTLHVMICGTFVCDSRCKLLTNPTLHCNHVLYLCLSILKKEFVNQCVHLLGSTFHTKQKNITQEKRFTNSEWIFPISVSPGLIGQSFLELVFQNSHFQSHQRDWRRFRAFDGLLKPMVLNNWDLHFFHLNCRNIGSKY